MVSSSSLKIVSTHSRPKAAASSELALSIRLDWFQHTAARRRLLTTLQQYQWPILVSTHSRPKAAAKQCAPCNDHKSGFNTQPPEGGCPRWLIRPPPLAGFNTQPPEGGCVNSGHLTATDGAVSTHSRPKAAALHVKCKSGDKVVSTHSRPKAAANDI